MIEDNTKTMQRIGDVAVNVERMLRIFDYLDADEINEHLKGMQDALVKIITNYDVKEDVEQRVFQLYHNFGDNKVQRELDAFAEEYDWT